jgi:hypothetical protein
LGSSQICDEPFVFCGFDVNGYGYETPVVEANKNPPLASFYLAFSAALFGWIEAGIPVKVRLVQDRRWLTAGFLGAVAFLG